MKALSAPLLLVVAALVTGCATPKPVRNVAQRGAATVALAEISLREYVAISDAQLSARMDLVRQDAQYLSEDVHRRELDRLLDQSAGVPADEPIEKKIRELAEQRRKVREKEAVARERIAATTRLDPAALGQVPVDKLAEARKRFAILAEELSATEWIALAAGYAQQISTDIKALTAKETPE